MTAGHALVLALGPPTGYAHIVQAPTIELAVVLGVATLIALARSLVRSLREHHDSSDWALPAISTIRSLGPARIIASVVVAHSAALFLGEALEQHASGVTLGGIAGLYGSTLAIAPLVHLAIAVAAGAILWLAARAVCENVRQAVVLVRAALAWLSRDERPSAPKIDRLVFVPCGPQSKPIAHNLANRPPPASVRFA
jgi:hypothetical protein